MAGLTGVYLACGGICCGCRSRLMCVSLGCVLGGLGCRGVSLGLFGAGVGIAWVGREVGGDKRVGFHALHSRMLSCGKGAGFLFCLIWVRFFNGSAGLGRKFECGYVFSIRGFC